MRLIIIITVFCFLLQNNFPSLLQSASQMSKFTLKIISKSCNNSLFHLLYYFFQRNHQYYITDFQFGSSSFFTSISIDRVELQIEQNYSRGIVEVQIEVELHLIEMIQIDMHKRTASLSITLHFSIKDNSIYDL